eukprot:CFRG8396T1
MFRPDLNRLSAVPTFINSLWKAGSHESVNSSSDQSIEEDFQYGASSHTYHSTVMDGEMGATDVHLTDKQVVQQAEPMWFDPEFDSIKHILEILPEENTRLYIMKEKQKQEVQLEAVSHTLAYDLLDKGEIFSQYTEELQATMLEIQKTHVICMNGRRNLQQFEEKASKMLLVLAKHRQRVHLTQLLQTLYTLKALKKNKARLADNIALGDYSEAFSLCSDCLKLTDAMQQYSCVQSIQREVSPLVTAIEGELSEYFKSLYRRFDEESYRKVLKVYSRTNQIDKLISRQSTYCEDVLAEVALDALRTSGCAMGTNIKWDQMTFKQASHSLSASDGYFDGLMRLCADMYVVLTCYEDVCRVHHVEPFQVEIPEFPLAENEDFYKGEEYKRVCGEDENTSARTVVSVREKQNTENLDVGHSGNQGESVDVSEDVSGDIYGESERYENENVAVDTRTVRKVSMEDDVLDAAVVALTLETHTVTPSESVADSTRITPNVSRQNSKKKKKRRGGKGKNKCSNNLNTTANIYDAKTETRETPQLNHEDMESHPDEKPSSSYTDEMNVPGESSVETIMVDAEDVLARRKRNGIDEQRAVLEHGRLTAWNASVGLVSAYIGEESATFGQASYQFDDYLNVLQMAHKYIAFGRLFCGDNSADLTASLAYKSGVFLKNFHKSRLEDVKAMLENERWHRIPVQTSFSVHTFREFAFLQDLDDLAQRSGEEALRWSAVATLKNQISEGRNPFMCTDDDVKEFRASTPDVPPVQRKSSLSPSTPRKASGHSRPNTPTPIDMLKEETPPMLCATTLNVLRLIGRYIQVLDAIPNVHEDVLTGLSQLIEYYIFAVYYFFGNPINSSSSSQEENNSLRMKMVTPPNKFETVLGSEELSNLLIKLRGMSSSGGLVISPGQVVAIPTLAYLVPINKSQELYGVAARVCGLESLKYVATILGELKPTLQKLCPPAAQSIIDTFYSGTVDQIDALCLYCSRNIATRMIKYDLPLYEMNMMRWDVDDIKTEQNKYVDTAIRELQQFSNRLTQLGQEKIPKHVYEMLWTQVIRCTMFMFVEGFSNVRRCSNEGRAMMMLDLKTFVTQVESVCTLRPIPFVKPVETFIKAFYLPEAALEEWLNDSSVYTKRQLETFIRFCATVDNFARTRLLNQLENRRKK